MDEYLNVLGLAILPALGNFIGGVLVEVFDYSNRFISLSLYAATGILLAIVGVELVPEALNSEAIWLVVLLFIVGAIFSVILDKVIEFIHQRTDQADDSDTTPLMIYFATAVDLFVDGLMISTGLSMKQQLGILLAVANLPSNIPEGFATIVSFKQKEVIRWKRILLSASFIVPVTVGATVGYWIIRDQSELVKLSLLAFTAGILLRVAIDEMLVQARKFHTDQDTEEDPLGVLMLVIGFSLFALITGYFGG